MKPRIRDCVISKTQGQLKHLLLQISRTNYIHLVSITDPFVYLQEFSIIVYTLYRHVVLWCMQAVITPP